MSKINPIITRVPQLTVFLMKVFVKLFVNWLSLREIISYIEVKFSRNYRFNQPVFTMFGAWIQDFLRGLRTIR